VLVIDDEGAGIPLDQRERVFEPFYRVDRSRSREPGGSGLGLTVARTFIRANGGDLRLDESPAGGLRVEVTLPRA
jgi:signal transduction histidine kinase